MGLLAPTKPYLPPDLVDETELLSIGSAESVLDHPAIGTVNGVGSGMVGGPPPSLDEFRHRSAVRPWPTPGSLCPGNHSSGCDLVTGGMGRLDRSGRSGSQSGFSPSARSRFASGWRAGPKVPTGRASARPASWPGWASRCRCSSPSWRWSHPRSTRPKLPFWPHRSWPVLWECSPSLTRRATNLREGTVRDSDEVRIGGQDRLGRSSTE